MSTTTQGQSDYTHFKEWRFGPLFAQALRISTAASVAQYAFYHADLNAGSGHNEKIDVEGSPINFLRAVERTRRENFYAFFIDHSPDAIRALTMRPKIEEYARRVSIFQADNRELLPTVAAFIAARERRPNLAVGSIVIDPNGYSLGVPWDAARVFCAEHTRIDLIMNLNVRTFQMERGNVRLNRKGWEGREHILISQFPKHFSRPNWMITDVCSIKGDRWVQLVGRTMPTQQPDYPSLGLYNLRSDRGQAIVESIEAPRACDQLSFL